MLIGSRQIISYLTTHAHPQMRKNVRTMTDPTPRSSDSPSETEASSTCYGPRPDSAMGAGEK